MQAGSPHASPKPAAASRALTAAFLAHEIEQLKSQVSGMSFSERGRGGRGAGRGSSRGGQRGGGGGSRGVLDFSAEASASRGGKKKMMLFSPEGHGGPGAFFAPPPLSGRTHDAPFANGYESVPSPRLWLALLISGSSQRCRAAPASTSFSPRLRPSPSPSTPSSSSSSRVRSTSPSPSSSSSLARAPAVSGQPISRANSPAQRRPPHSGRLRPNLRASCHPRMGAQVHARDRRPVGRSALCSQPQFQAYLLTCVPAQSSTPSTF